MELQERKELLQHLHRGFKQPITVDAVQKKDYGDKAQGYNIAYLVDRMNHVLFENGCNWVHKFMPVESDKDLASELYTRDSIVFGEGKKKESIAVRLRIIVIDPEGETLLEKESFGGCQLVNNSLGDTLKGAQTDAMKKALSYLGIGDLAFKGNIDDQLRAHFFFTDEVMNKIETGLKLAHNLEEVPDKIKMRYIVSVTKKAYNIFDDITESDWHVIDKAITDLMATPPKPKKKTTKKKQVKNEQSGDGESEVPASTKQVDNPFPDDAEPPF